MVITDDGLDIRVAKRLDRARAISAAMDTATLKSVVTGLRQIDDGLRSSGITDIDRRLSMLSHTGSVSLSPLGTFVADESSYEDRLSRIMQAMVDAEPAARRQREKRSRLLTQMKKVFREERVMAQKGEDLASHRIVSGLELEEGLVADLALKNGSMHFVETVDASGDAESPRKALGDIGISALVLERARMKFGDKNTTTRLVYNASPSLEKIARPSLEAAEHQGSTLDQLGERGRSGTASFIPCRPWLVRFPRKPRRGGQDY